MLGAIVQKHKFNRISAIYLPDCPLLEVLPRAREHNENTTCSHKSFSFLANISYSFKISFKEEVTGEGHMGDFKDTDKVLFLKLGVRHMVI